jgi:hypothetical protein
MLIFVRAQLVLSLSPPSRCPFWVKMCKVGHKATHEDWKALFQIGTINIVFYWRLLDINANSVRTPSWDTGCCILSYAYRYVSHTMKYRL